MIKIYPKISIVTPSYNQGKYIEKTITSVLNQNYPNLEYIIIDGGSNDETIEIVNKYLNQITYFISEIDKGCADALNKGLLECTGEIFMYLNSDDYLLPNSLFSVVESINKYPNYQVYFGHGICNDEISGRIYNIYSSMWNKYFYISKACYLVQQSTFFRLKDVKNELKFNIQNRTCWDSELIIDLSNKGFIFKRLPFSIKIGVFRLHKDSVTGSQKQVNQYLIDQKRIFRKVIKNSNVAFIFPSFLFKYLVYFIDPILKIKRFISKIN